MKCSEVVIQLSEFSNNTLNKYKTLEVKKHLSICKKCLREETLLDNLSIKLNDLELGLPKIDKQEIIKDIFIKEKKNNLLSKVLFGFLLFVYLFSFLIYEEKNYINLNYMKERSNNIYFKGIIPYNKSTKP